MPSFDVRYDVDFRQDIADSWPKVLNDSHARSDWDWDPDFSLEAMVDDMLETLLEREQTDKNAP